MTAYVQERFPLARVLIADDSMPLRSGLCKLIEEEHTGWVCAEALNGRDAITKIQQWPPDILILDLCMPVMDGHSVNSYLISASSSVQLTSRLPWFPWHNIAAYKARFQNTITVRFSAGLRRCSDTRRSSVGIKVFERLLGSNA